MSSAVPLSVAGRSPFDPIRLRWGGLGGVGLGVALLCTAEPAGIVFGILFMLLGLATWLITSFGKTPWSALSPLAQGVAGTGSVIGLLSLLGFFLVAFLVFWAIQLFANSR